MNNAQNLKKVFSKNLSFYIEKFGTSQTEVAQKLGIPEMTMSNWINSKTYPRVDKVQLLADYFRINRSDLTEEKPTNLIEVSPATVRIPILGKISCGDPLLSEENFKDYRNESPDMLPGGTLFYLEADGKSMEPTIPNGSLVLIREQPEVEYGEIAAVLVNGDEEATLKRVRKQGDTIILMPDNRDYEPYIVTEENPARVVGKAIRFTQDL